MFFRGQLLWWRFTYNRLSSHYPLELGSNTSSKSENRRINYSPPKKKICFNILRCFFCFGKHYYRRSFVFSLNSLNVMQFGSKTCSSFGTILQVLSIETSLWYMFIFWATTWIRETENDEQAKSDEEMYCYKIACYLSPSLLTVTKLFTILEDCTPG